MPSELRTRLLEEPRYLVAPLRSLASVTGSNVAGNQIWEYKAVREARAMAQDDANQNVPASAEDEDGWNDEEDLEEDDGSLVVEEEDEEGGDYYLHRVERLLRADERDELPRLHAEHLFSAHSVITASGLTVNLERRVFDARLKQFLSRHYQTVPDVTPVSDFLFDQAVHALKLLTAWGIIVENAKRPDLAKTREYLQQQVNLSSAIRTLVREQRKSMPSWMGEWASYWIGAFDEIGEEIESQLRCAKITVDSIANKGISPRLEMRSFIVWAKKEEIRKRIENTPLSRSLEPLHAAFAYAAELVPVSEQDVEGYLDVIKQRASRVSRSEEKRREAAVSLLTTMLEIPDHQTEQEQE
jgi:hypothetical protein